MREWNLRIELKSDFCTATGENAPGMISSKTALEYGIPKIPAKRIKGCLLESGRELADNGMIAGELLSRIFGCPGSLGGEGIRVGDGHLSLVPEYLFNQEKKENFMICDYEQFLKNVKDCQDIEDSGRYIYQKKDKDGSGTNGNRECSFPSHGTGGSLRPCFLQPD